MYFTGRILRGQEWLNMSKETVKATAQDIEIWGVPDRAMDYGRTAAQRWMQQCRKQATKCPQDCVDCIYEEVEDHV